MTPKRHAIAKEIIKLLYPGPPFGAPDFFVWSHFLFQTMESICIAQRNRTAS